MKTIDTRNVILNATPEEAFTYIEKMPSKFPTFRLFETRPFLFLRVSLVDGIKTGIKVACNKKYRNEMMGPISLGSSFGPFTLTEIDKPNRYYFTINSYFFKGETGYIISQVENNTVLNFNTETENPKIIQKIWWYIVKPIHIILANLVLRNIKMGLRRSKV